MVVRSAENAAALGVDSMAAGLLAGGMPGPFWGCFPVYMLPLDDSKTSKSPDLISKSVVCVVLGSHLNYLTEGNFPAFSSVETEGFQKNIWISLS